MELDEFYKMSLEEIYAFQEKNRSKIKNNKEKIKELKERNKRYIKRGQIASDLVPRGSLQEMDEETFFNELCRLIYHN